MAFQDHFSRQAEGYTRFRPRYPRQLYEFLALTVERRDWAWDCGTGNGQAAVDLAEFFQKVIATDPSASQIAHAQQHPGVEYLVCSAEQCSLPAGWFGLITVAQALHWFDLEPFYQQVRRVGRPGAILAAWTYGLMSISPAVDRAVGRLYEDILGAYWPPERKLVEERYATMAFPFEEIPAPSFSMGGRWNLEDLLGYLGTWSSTQAFIKRHGTDPVQKIRPELAAAWGDLGDLRDVSWPLYLRVGRI